MKGVDKLKWHFNRFRDTLEIEGYEDIGPMWMVGSLHVHG